MNRLLLLLVLLAALLTGCALPAKPQSPLEVAPPRLPELPADVMVPRQPDFLKSLELFLSQKRIAPTQ